MVVLVVQGDVLERQLRPARHDLVGDDGADLQDVPLYHQYYHAYLLQYRAALDEVIDANPDALRNTAQIGRAHV